MTGKSSRTAKALATMLDRVNDPEREPTLDELRGENEMLRRQLGTMKQRYADLQAYAKSLREELYEAPKPLRVNVERLSDEFYAGRPVITISEAAKRMQYAGKASARYAAAYRMVTSGRWESVQPGGFNSPIKVFADQPLVIVMKRQKSR